MAAINGINGVPHISTTTTLDDLLKDGKFGLDDTQVMNTDDNREQNYQTCLTAFIRGDPKECLEKMYECGFLESHALAQNEQIYALFQGACDAVKNFNSLGISLQTVLRRIFTGDADQLRDYFIGKSRAFEIAISNRYYRCCAKVLQMNSHDHSAEVAYLERKTRNDIDRHTCQSLTEDPESLVELQQLVETYIFHIQIALFHRKESSSLYRELSEAVPGLSKNFRKTTNNGKSAEQCILDRLESTQRKSQNVRRRSSLAHVHQKEVSEKALLVPDPGHEAATTAAPSTALQQQQRRPQQQQVTPRWFSILHRFISRFEYSRQTMLIAFVLLLLSTRKIGRLSRLPQYVTAATRSALPHIQNLLKLLSSV